MSFVRTSLVVSVGQVGGIGLNVLGTMILARALREQMGQYDLFRNAAIIGITVAALGVGAANVYLINSRGAAPDVVARNTLALWLVNGSVLAAGLTLAILAFPRYFGRAAHPLPEYFALGTAALLGVLLLRSLFLARMDAARMITVDVVPPAVVLLGAGWLWAAGRLEVRSALYLQATGNLAGLACALVFLRAPLLSRARVDLPLVREALVYGLKLSGGNLLLVLGSSATVLLLRYLTLDAGDFGPVALYTRAAALCGLMSLLPLAVAPLLYSRWASGAGGDLRGQVEQAARLNVAYGLSAALFLAVFARGLLTLVYGDAFAGAAPAVYLLAPASGLLALTSVFVSLFASDGRAGASAGVLGLFLVVSVLGTLLLVPALGMVGAAAGALLGQLAGATAALAVARRTHAIRPGRCLVPTPGDIGRLLAGLRAKARPA